MRVRSPFQRDRTMTEDTPRAPSPIDSDAVLANPSAYFNQPQDVLVHPDMSNAFKLKLLRQWELDARLLAEAEGEGMGGGEESRLGRVRQALRTLEARMEDAGAGQAQASIGVAARNVAGGLGEAANRAHHVAARTQEHITEFRAFMRAQPITGALLIFAFGYLIGRTTVIRRR
jgi:hypothetical protein